MTNYSLNEFMYEYVIGKHKKYIKAKNDSLVPKSNVKEAFEGFLISYGTYLAYCNTQGIAPTKVENGIYDYEYGTYIGRVIMSVSEISRHTKSKRENIMNFVQYINGCSGIEYKVSLYFVDYHNSRYVSVACVNIGGSERKIEHETYSTVTEKNWGKEFSYNVIRDIAKELGYEDVSNSYTLDRYLKISKQGISLCKEKVRKLAAVKVR